MTSKIFKIAVELEGKWNRDIEPEIYEDGSVEFDEDDEGSCNCECYCNELEDQDDQCSVCLDGCQGDCNRSDRSIGEISSSPLKLGKLLEWIDLNYPDETNSSCGLHIHVSTIDRLSYSKLMSSSFNTYFQKRFRTWGEKHNVKGEFWKRLDGSHWACLGKFNPEIQVKQTDKYHSFRYTQLNYCYNIHSTLECRLLPCFRDKWIALSAVREFYDIVNKYLIRQPKEKEYKFELEINDHELKEIMNEELTICV